MCEDERVRANELSSDFQGQRLITDIDGNFDLFIANTELSREKHTNFDKEF